MSMLDEGFENESASTNFNDVNCHPLTDCEDIEIVRLSTDSICDADEWEMENITSCASSVYDSGFNSDNEDCLHDFDNNMVKIISDFGSEIEVSSCNFQNSAIEIEKSFACSDNASAFPSSQDLPLRGFTQDRKLYKRKSISRTNADLNDRTEVEKIVMNNQRKRRVIANPSFILGIAANRRTCRHRAQDINNNETRSRNLSSYLKRAPFRLQDCFHNQGLLSLIVCIIYTLFLMVVAAVLNTVLDSLKSSIGTQKLKNVRENVHSRRTRMSMALG